MITQGFFPTLIHAEDVKLDNQKLAIVKGGSVSIIMGNAQPMFNIK